MNQELESFRDQLREAGQPWSRRGVFTCGAGMVGLVVCQVAPSSMAALVAVLVSFAVLMVGWVFLVIAFRQRRRWARAQALHEPPLSIEPDAP